MAGRKKLAAEWGLVIDEDLRDLLPRDPLKVKLLESQIVDEGCRDAIVVWRGKNIIADGYTRYDICNERDIPFEVIYMDWPSKAEVMQWALHNQWARRNLTTAQRIEAASKIEDVLKAEAKERQGTRTDLDNLVENFPQSTKSRDQLGALAGVSGKTYEKGATVLKEAPEEIKDMYRKGKISTDAAYSTTRMNDKERQQVVDAIIAGDEAEKKPVEVIRNIRKSRNPAGFNKEMRASFKETRMLSQGMRDAENKPEYTLEMVLDEIKNNGTNLVRMIGNIIRDHEDLVKPQGIQSVIDAMDKYIIEGINEIRRTLA